MSDHADITKTVAALTPLDQNRKSATMNGERDGSSQPEYQNSRSLCRPKLKKIVFIHEKWKQKLRYKPADSVKKGETSEHAVVKH